MRLVLSTLKLKYERPAVWDGPDDTPQYLIKVDVPGDPLDGKVVAVVRGSGDERYNRNVAEPLARLMTASPDLFNALRNMRETWSPALLDGGLDALAKVRVPVGPGRTKKKGKHGEV